MSGTSSLGKRGGILRAALGDASIRAMPLRVQGTVTAQVTFRRTLSELGTRPGARQLHKGDDT